MFIEANRLNNVKFSAVREVMAEMNQLQNEGKIIIPFQIGQPDFFTPQSIIDATKNALDRKLTHYAPNRGTINLRKAVQKLLKRRGLEYSAEDEILITVGGAEAINNALLSIINEGDEVIVPSPAYMNYENVINMGGGIFVELPMTLEDGFQVNVEELRKKITKKTKMIIINNPSNPTGVVFSRKVLEQVAEVAIENNLIVFSDEIYDENLYGDTECISIATIEGMRERTIVMNGFSKAYAMTGWRLGYLAGPSSAINMCLKVHQYATTCAPTFIQEGVAEAILTEQCEIEKKEMMSNFAIRREIVIKELNAIPELKYSIPEGAFYVYVNVEKAGLNGMEFVKKLLHEKYVAVVPGVGFSSEGENFIRISFATSEENIKEGFSRIRAMVNENLNK